MENNREEKIPIPSATNKRSVWLHVGTLIDGTSAAPLHDVHVVYNSDSILHVSTTQPPLKILNPGQARPDLLLPDCTLLPGLIEAHAHLYLEGGELNPERRSAYLKQTPEELLARAMKRLERLVQLGVIAVRDAGDKDGVGLALRKRYLKKDNLLLPYVDSPGAAIYHQGRYGRFMAEVIENYSSPRDCVKSRIAAGADRIKLIATDIIDFKKGAVVREPQMSAVEISALVTAAKEFGKQAFAHASGATGIELVIDGGIDSVEHGFFIREDQLAKMRDRQIAWCPTFAPVQKQIDHADQLGWDEKTISNLKKILDQHASRLLQGQRLGVIIVAGSDAGSYGVSHGFGLLFELELMERAGLSPLSVINAATGNSSLRLGFKEKFGQIKPGYQSRFIITRHSPLETVSNLLKDKFVVYDGAVYDSGSIIVAGL